MLVFSIYFSTIPYKFLISLREMEVSSATDKTLLEHKIRELEFQKARLEREKTSLEGDLTASQKEVVGLKCSVAEMSASSSGLRAELETLQRNYQAEKSAKEKLTTELSDANNDIEQLKVYPFIHYNYLLFF